MVREEDVEGIEPLDESLGIVEAIDSDHEIAAAEAGNEFLY